MVSRFVRKVRTASGAAPVQVAMKDRGRPVEVDHVGSGHTDAELALLLEVAGERLRLGQEALDLGPLPQAEVRVSDVADFTAPRRLNLGGAGGLEDGAGRTRMVADGGRVVSTGSLLLWQVLADANLCLSAYYLPRRAWARGSTASGGGGVRRPLRFAIDVLAADRPTGKGRVERQGVDRPRPCRRGSVVGLDR